MSRGMDEQAELQLLYSMENDPVSAAEQLKILGRDEERKDYCKDNEQVYT